MTIRRPRNGKIARLPAALKLEINRKLQDNVLAPRIIAWLKADHAAELKAAALGDNMLRNISNWRQGGYADWVRQQERLEEMKAQRELAFEIAQQNDGTVQAANLALAASHIYEALQDFDVRELITRLQDKPELYSILIEGVSKLSRAGLGEKKLQLELTKYQDRVAEQKRKIEEQLGKAKTGAGLTPEVMAQIQDALNLL